MADPKPITPTMKSPIDIPPAPPEHTTIRCQYLRETTLAVFVSILNPEGEIIKLWIPFSQIYFTRFLGKLDSSSSHQDIVIVKSWILNKTTFESCVDNQI